VYIECCVVFEGRLVLFFMEYPGLEISLDRSELLSAVVEMSVDLLASFGVSLKTIDTLQAMNIKTIEEIAVLNVGDFPSTEFNDSAKLIQLISDVRAICTEKMLKATTQKDVLPVLQVKNTFLQFSPGKQINNHQAMKSCPVPSIPSTHSSIISSDHAQGACKPCAWYHHPGGCKNGSSCGFCHQCPPGELKRRKKEKETLLKLFRSPKKKSGNFDSKHQSNQQQTSPSTTTSSVYWQLLQ
jgi:hypothetical protein